MKQTQVHKFGSSSPASIMSKRKARLRFQADGFQCKIIAISLVLIVIGMSDCMAETKQIKKLPADSSAKTEATTKVVYVSAKKVILVPGSRQQITSGEKTLTIEFSNMHKTGNFPIIRIQSIPFKLTKPGDNLEFTWQQAGYELMWLPNSQKVSLASSAPFAQQTFSVKDKDVKNDIIYKGLIVETKRKNGLISKLEVVDLEKDAKGQMQKFSVKTYADKQDSSEYHNENNIMAPEYHKQYEKGINDEILFVFTSDEKGQIHVYYR